MLSTLRSMAETFKYSRFVGIGISPLQTKSGLVMNQPNKYYRLPAIVLITFIALAYGCSNTIHETIRSNPSQADIYWGKSSRNLINSGDKTPYQNSVSESRIEHRCFQLRKQGYQHSRIYCREKNVTSFLVNVDLVPEKLTPAKQNEREGKPNQKKKNNHVTISWEYENPHNISGFEIERRKESDEQYEKLGVVGPNTTTYTDTEIEADTTYRYRLRAYNADTKSEYIEIQVEILKDGNVIQK